MRAHAHGQLALRVALKVSRVAHKAPRTHPRGPGVVHAERVQDRWLVEAVSRAGYKPPHRAVGSRHNRFSVGRVRHSDVGAAEHVSWKTHKSLEVKRGKLVLLAVRLVTLALKPQRAILRHHQALIHGHRHHHGLFALKVVRAQAPKYRISPVHRPCVHHVLAAPEYTASRFRHCAALASIRTHKLHLLVIKHRRVRPAHREKIRVRLTVG